MKIKNTPSFRDVLLPPVRLLGVRMISGPRALNRLGIESRTYDSVFFEGEYAGRRIGQGVWIGIRLLSQQSKQQRVREYLRYKAAYLECISNKMLGPNNLSRCASRLFYEVTCRVLPVLRILICYFLHRYLTALGWPMRETMEVL